MLSEDGDILNGGNQDYNEYTHLEKELLEKFKEQTNNLQEVGLNYEPPTPNEKH